MTTIAARIFEGDDALYELEHGLREAGAPFDRLGRDDYDCSLEIHGVPADYRLSPEAQQFLHSAGFAKVYVNHADKWETHYNFRGEFKPSDGWRVSYPHKRGENETGIW